MGVFLRICAEAAEESRAEGREDITPYWRVASRDGSLMPKFPGGFEIVPGLGKKPPVVKDCQRYLVDISVGPQTPIAIVTSD